jgi:hypothetical protein
VILIYLNTGLVNGRGALLKKNPQLIKLFHYFYDRSKAGWKLLWLSLQNIVKLDISLQKP